MFPTLQHFEMTRLLLFLCIEITVTSLLSTAQSINHVKSYSGYSVFRVIPQTTMQLDYLRDLEQEMALEASPIEFWKLGCCVGTPSDVMVGPISSYWFMNQLQKLGMQPQVLIDDVASTIENQRVIGRASQDDFFSNYHPINEIFSFMDQLKSMSDTNEIEVIGKSTEGRDLRVLKIGNSTDKPIIWIDGGTHAREWIGPATALFMAYQVASGKQRCQEQADSCDPDIKLMTDQYDFYFEPSVNPDGYVFSHESDRLWRKTRSSTDVNPWSIFCKGVDPNRNYNAKWGGEGSSGNPCAQTYAGKAPHSEPEVKSLTNKVLSISKRVAMFLSLHSYSQIMLLPYGHSSDVPKEYDDLFALATKGAAALKAVHGTNYRIGSSARILYAASGTASDWAFDGAGIKYSYTFELPDEGDEGFLLSPEKIRPVGEETWAGVKTMIMNLPPPALV